MSKQLGSRSSRTAIIALSLVAALSLLLAAGAPAGKKHKKPKKAATQISINLTATSSQFLDFSGAVTSSAAKCTRGRQVELSFVEDSNGIVSHRGNPTTDDQGNWALPHVGHHGGPGNYVASIGKVTRGKTACKGSQASVHFP